MIMIGANPLLGPLEEVGPENIDFFGPKWHLSSLVAISGPKKVPSHIKNRYIKS
jgi:hypothetical protein